MRDEDRADAIVADWLASREDGHAPDPAEVIRTHPELAALLQDRFTAWNLVDLAFGAPPAPPPTPRRVGPYRIVQRLGSGGMGTVFRAEVTEPVAGIATGGTVALKVLHPHLLGRRGFFERFLREADLGRRIHHPNVVRTLAADASVEDGRSVHFLVMEYVEGQTLRDLRDELERVPEELCRHVGCEVLRSLVAIHGSGAVHRDLKPENVLITPDHRVKVMDLGVARLADETVRLSQTGAFVGSLDYAAPEQFADDGSSVDARADLHALGVLLYELSTGRHPFAGHDVRVVMRKILDEAPRPAGELNSQLSPFFEEFVRQLLEKSPDARHADAAEALAILERGERSAWWAARARALRAATRAPLRRVRVPRETAVYGREEELAALRGLYERASAGDGRVVLIEGEAGIGKTRLVDELAARLVAGGEEIHFLHASYPPGGAATASGAFLAAFRSHLGETDLEPAVARVLPQTPLLVPAFSALLRGDAPPDGVLGLTKDSLQTCFVEATRCLSEERTTVVLIDDLHFAPAEGRALFSSLALALPRNRVLLVGTLRPGVPADWVAGVTRLDHAEHRRLARLGAKDLVSLLEDSLGSARLAEELAGKIARKSDGNPFFVFEIIRGLREGQFLRQRADGSWETTRVIDEIDVPSSVIDLVNARVADLSDEERDLLDVAACWGYEFDPVLIGEALGLDRIAALRRLARIERRHRLVRSAGEHFRFDHHQVQEALVQTLAAPLARAYHGMLANAVLERRGAPGRRAPATGSASYLYCYHSLRSDAPSVGAEDVEEALDHVESRYRVGDAVDLARRALSLAGALVGPARVRVMLRLAEQLGMAGRSDEQVAITADARSVAPTEEWWVRATNAHAQALLRAGRIADAEAAAQAARAAGERQGLSDCVATAMGTEAICALRRSDLGTARRRFVEWAKVAARRGDARSRGRALGGLGNVYYEIGQYVRARRYHRRHLRLAQRLDDRQAAVGATGNIGNTLYGQGDFSAAAPRYAAQLEGAREIGDRLLQAMAHGNLGNVLTRTGALSEAAEHLRYQRDLADALGYPAGGAIATANLAGVHEVRGEVGAELRCRREAVAVFDDLGMASAAALERVNLGTALLRVGALEEAESELRRGLELARALEAADTVRCAIRQLGLLAAERGDVDGAADLLRRSACGDRSDQDTDTVLDFVALAELSIRRGDLAAARESIDVAARECAALGGESQPPSLAAIGAFLGTAPLDAAVRVVDARRVASSRWARVRCAWWLWRTAGEGRWLDEAIAELSEIERTTPAEHARSLWERRQLHRDVRDAWRAARGAQTGAPWPG